MRAALVAVAIAVAVLGSAPSAAAHASLAPLGEAYFYLNVALTVFTGLVCVAGHLWLRMGPRIWFAIWPTRSSSPQRSARTVTPASLPAGPSRQAYWSVILGVFGICANLCACATWGLAGFSVAAAVHGHLELKAIQAGRASAAGRSVANAGLMLGVVGIGLFALWVALLLGPQILSILSLVSRR